MLYPRSGKLWSISYTLTLCSSVLKYRCRVWQAQDFLWENFGEYSNLIVKHSIIFCCLEKQSNLQALADCNANCSCQFQNDSPEVRSPNTCIWLIFTRSNIPKEICRWFYQFLSFQHALEIPKFNGFEFHNFILLSMVGDVYRYTYWRIRVIYQYT